MTPYECSYRFEGKSYSITIYAESSNEALMRIWAIGWNGKVDGERVIERKVPGVIERIINWVKGKS